MPSLSAAARYIRGVSKGLSRGDFFPAASRVAPQQAPGGSAYEALPGGFRLGRHRIPVKGLDRPLQILQLTDVHLRDVSAGHRRLILALADLRADVVVLTGDIVAREWTPTALDDFLCKLPRGRLGTYAVLGNWEHWTAELPTWERIYGNHRVTLLREQTVEVGGVQLVGLDDHLAGQSDPSALLDGLNLEVPTVVLAHSPDAIGDIARPGVDLVLSGHTHGGQMVLPKAGALWVPKGSGPYIRGFYSIDDCLLYVCPGLGWSVAPLRLRCPPEAALHILEPA